MAEPPANIARKAKGLQQGLKDLLKINDPWDKEVEFQRKDLRKKYLTLLLLHPYARESKDAETHLWMQTSYNFISIYKQRLAVLDRAIQAAKQQPQQHQQQGRRGDQPPIVEHRKLTQRFKQFLAEEEKFWAQLIVRYHREFALDEARPLLATLGIVPAVDEPTDDAQLDQATRRHAVFPPEDAPHPPSTPSERSGRLNILSKAMICLGDISRYRELYNDNRGRNGARRGRGGGSEPAQRPRNFEKALQCYEKARILTPDVGNASHQLAILSAYNHDVFTSMVHYYRALCVRHPYETAAGNFGTILNRAYDQWKRAKRDRERKHNRQGSSPVSPKVRVDAFKDNVVLLHALWRFDPQKIDAEAPGHAVSMEEEFKALIAERILPIDMISKIVVLSQGALWKYRMVRDSSNSSKKGSPSSAARPSTERRIFLHLLSIHRVLLEVGLDELKEPPHPDIAENDLAQRISAVFRRTLPALRIAGKWLKANHKYVLRGVDSSVVEKDEGADEDATQAFWSVYAQFFCALIRAFPVEGLPSVKAPLEEDIDMKGFLPLRKTMGELQPSKKNEEAGNTTLPESQSEEQVHPNVEQLMRIHDLLTDAKEVVAIERCPVTLYGNRFVLKGIESIRQPVSTSTEDQLDEEPSPTVPQQQLLESIRDGGLIIQQSLKADEDLMTEATSRTEDDPVGDAFRQVLASNQEVDDDEEQIVWDPRPPLSPISPLGFSSPSLSQTPLTPVKAPVSPIRPPITPTHRSTMSAQLSASPPHVRTTAQDLLNSFGISPRAKVTAPPSTAPQPQLLFGSGSLSNPGNSIWSATIDDQVMNAAGQNSIMYQSVPQTHHVPSLSQPQSTWQSSQATSSQYSQYNLPGGLPSQVNFHPMQLPMSQTHQRVPSATVPIGHELYSTPANITVGSHHISPSFSNLRHPLHSLSHPAGNAYRPIEGALYETPHTAYPSDGSLIGLHGRHLSLVDDPRMGSISRPLPQAWGNVG